MEETTLLRQKRIRSTNQSAMRERLPDEKMPMQALPCFKALFLLFPFFCTIRSAANKQLKEVSDGQSIQPANKRNQILTLKQSKEKKKGEPGCAIRCLGSPTSAIFVPIVPIFFSFHLDEVRCAHKPMNKANGSRGKGCWKQRTRATRRSVNIRQVDQQGPLHGT